jgi:hypothetical protein
MRGNGGYNRLVRSLLEVMSAVAVAFAVVLVLGFYIHSKTDAIPDNVFGVIAGISIGAIACAIVYWPRGPRRKTGKVSVAAVMRTPLPSPEARAYESDPNATASCPHLQPIEHAMRMAGIDVKWKGISPYHPIVEAACRINEPELRKRFALPASVYYKEGYQPERSEWDNPRGDIFCGECLQTDRARCDIQVLHPSECTPGTPWFPSPP